MIHTVKKCYKCKEHKQYKEFSKNRSTPDGYSNPCRKCKTKYDIKYKKEIKLMALVSPDPNAFLEHKTMKWTKEKLLGYMAELKPSQLNWTELKKLGKMKIYWAGKKYFGTWTNALAALKIHQNIFKTEEMSPRQIAMNLHKTDDLDINTHISERDGRHEPYCTMLKEIAQRIGYETKGSVLSLCGVSPLVDKTRIQTWFHGSDTYIWYEIKQNIYDKIKKKAMSLDKILAGYVKHEIHHGNILESKHENVALLNLDLEGPGSIMTEKLMTQVESIILSALTGRKRSGLILNTHTRGPKGMTRCKRIALWYTLLSNVESKGYRVVKPIEPVSYTTAIGSQMQLYAVAFEKI